MAWYGALLEFDLPVGRMLRRTKSRNGLGWYKHDVALYGHPIGVFDGAQAGGYPGFARGDGLAVALAVGAFGRVWP